MYFLLITTERSIFWGCTMNETDKSFECRELSRRLRACAQKKSILRGSGESYGYSYDPYDEYQDGF